MQGQNAPMVQRDIRTVTAEIRAITETTRQMVLDAIVEIGRRLKEAKSMLPHGEWGHWLETEVEFKQSTANNYMQIFDAYAADQMTLDGAVVKSQTLGKLSYSKALALLALPSEEEREAFVSENDVAAMSSRELKKALEELKKAKSQQQYAEEAVYVYKGEIEELEEQLAKAEKELEAQRDRTAEAEEKAREAEKVISGERKTEAQKHAEERADEAERKARAAEEEQATALKAQAEAEAKVKQLEEALKAAKEKPKIPKDMKEDLIAQGKEAMAAEIQEAEKKRIAAEEAAGTAAGKLDAAQREIEALRKQLAGTAPGVERFKVCFEQVQTDFRALERALEELRKSDRETAGKLGNAVMALLDALRKRMEG